MTSPGPPNGSFNPAYNVLARFEAITLGTARRFSEPQSRPAGIDTGAPGDAATRSGDESDSSSIMSGALPANDGMSRLREEMHRIRDMALSSEEKAMRMHALMTADYDRWRAEHLQPMQDAARSPQLSIPARLTSPSPTPTAAEPAENPYHIHDSDLQPTFCPPSPVEEGEQDDRVEDLELGCGHYKRNVKVQCATCLRWYPCRLCHDEEISDHKLIRKDIQNMLCMGCLTPQPAAEYCCKCSLLTASYYCSTCKLWDNDVRRRIYHCDDCGICRRGEGIGKDYVHCKRCNVCISIAHADTHRCVERATECDCPICGDYLFTSSDSVVAMRCGHYIHQSCYDAYMETSYKCPICNRSAVNMELQWRKLDHCIEVQPMPEAYRSTRVWVTCNDCGAHACVRYHWLGNKCAGCDSYNTNEGKMVNGPQEEVDEDEDLRRALEQRGRDLLERSLADGGAHDPALPEAPALRSGEEMAEEGDGGAPIHPLLPPHSPTGTSATAVDSDAQPQSPVPAMTGQDDVDMADTEDNEGGSDEEQDLAGFWGVGIQPPSWNINPREWASQRFFAKSDNGDVDEEEEMAAPPSFLGGRYFPNINPREWASQRFFAKSDDEGDDGDGVMPRSARSFLQRPYFPNINPREWAHQHFFAKSDEDEDDDEEQEEWRLATSAGLFRGRYFTPRGGYARLFGRGPVRAISADAIPKSTPDSRSESDPRGRVGGWGIGPSWPGQMPAWIAARIPRPSFGAAGDVELGDEGGVGWSEWALRAPSGGWTSPKFFGKNMNDAPPNESDGSEGDEEESLDSNSEVGAEGDGDGEAEEDEGVDLVDLPGHR